MMLHFDRDAMNHQILNRAMNAHTIACGVCLNKEDLYLQKKR